MNSKIILCNCHLAPLPPPPSHHTQSDYIVLCFQLCRCYIMLKFIYSENTKATPVLSSKPVMGKMTSQSATFPRIKLYQLPILPAFLPRAESIKLESSTLESTVHRSVRMCSRVHQFQFFQEYQKSSAHICFPGVSGGPQFFFFLPQKPC